MTEMEMDDGRNFENLNAHDAQVALAEELMGASQEDSVDEGTPDGEDNSQSEDEKRVVLSEHVRMAEALLFAAAEPLDEKSIADRLPQDANIAGVIERLRADYETRGVNLKKIDGKWRFLTAADVSHILEKEKVTPRKLSRAALETLAVIAYHQPCTRADIEDVRGVAVSKGSLDQLLEIGWARIRGKRRDVPGRPILYGTTDAFLEHFGLESVQDLPGLADLKAAGLLDARLPPGFSIPTPSDGDEEEAIDKEADEAEFAQDFLGEEDETAGA